MHDPRLDELANVLTTHSTKVQPGEFVLIEGIDIPQEMVIALIRAVRKAGGIPLVELKQNRIQREIILGGDDAGIKLIGEYEMYRMKKVQAYIGIRGSHNITEMSDVPSEAIQRYQKNWLRPLNDIRVPHTKWVVLRWPHPAMAQQAKMSTEAFEDYYFNVCTLDYSRMEQAMAPLKSLMEETDEIHIVGEDTDLRFSIKDIPVIPCAGEYNIPDGECFTSPVRDSVNGTIHFNTPTIYQGTTFTDIDSALKMEKSLKHRRMILKNSIISLIQTKGRAISASLLLPLIPTLQIRCSIFYSTKRSQVLFISHPVRLTKKRITVSVPLSIGIW